MKAIPRDVVSRVSEEKALNLGEIVLIRYLQMKSSSVIVAPLDEANFPGFTVYIGIIPAYVADYYCFGKELEITYLGTNFKK